MKNETKIEKIKIGIIITLKKIINIDKVENNTIITFSHIPLSIRVTKKN